jgi:hypothetical protein
MSQNKTKFKNTREYMKKSNKDIKHTSINQQEESNNIHKQEESNNRKKYQAKK